MVLNLFLIKNILGDVIDHVEVALAGQQPE